MITQLRRDKEDRPSLFDFVGPVDLDRLRDWLAVHSITVPAELIRLWTEVGGATMFESETILGPLGDSALGDDVLSSNTIHRGRGLPDGYLVFHTGLFVSTVDLAAQQYVVFDRSYHIVGRFRTLAEWYSGAVRAHFAERYGLE